MVDAHARGACEVIHGGSSPLLGTFETMSRKWHDFKYIGVLT